eukprot:1745625-Prymnesium_polylepis.1
MVPSSKYSLPSRMSCASLSCARHSGRVNWGRGNKQPGTRRAGNTFCASVLVKFDTIRARRSGS